MIHGVLGWRGALLVGAALVLHGSSGQQPRSLARSANYAPDPGARWFKGNTHTHTNRSDGDSAPEVVARWYGDHGYDFVVLTDHDTVTATDALAPEPQRFLVLPGEEVTASYRRTDEEAARPVHVNALGPRAIVVPWKGPTAKETVAENVRRVRQAAGLPQVNHPNFGWALTDQDLDAIPDLRLEIWSGHPLTHNEGGGDRPSAEVLWERLLDRGGHVYGVAVDDAHHFQGEFGPERANPGRGFVCVRSRQLAQGAILEALGRGDFYASSGVVLKDVVADASGLTVTIEPRGSFRYTTTFLGPRGRVLLSSTEITTTYRWRGDEAYVRAKIVDSQGRAAWVQPVFLASASHAGEGVR